jgi:endonuclease/exonuclease/phosphatase family metal-dependent hydrolase
MSHVLRKLTKRIFVIATICVALIFLLACSSALVHPSRFWPIAMLGVTFAVWLMASIAIFFFWLFFRSKWAWLPFITIVIGWPVVNAFFGTNLFSSFKNQKKANSLRIMQWNVARWDEMQKYWAPGKISKRLKMYDYIKQHDVDVLCVQEFFESNNTKEFEKNIPYLRDTLGFNYHYFAMDHRRWDSLYESGVAIFSKYPIVDTFRKRYGGPDSLKNNESFIYTDIDVKGKRIRVFTSHLQSMLLGGADFKKIRELRRGSDSAVDKTKGLIKKFRRAYDLRLHQVSLLKPALNSSPYPEIFCGDFNEVPTSYIYFQLKGNRKDAFSHGGFGVGRTLSFISPTLRIDYILCNSKFKVLQCKRDKVALSDHYPVIADLQLPGE